MLLLKDSVVQSWMKGVSGGPMDGVTWWSLTTDHSLPAEESGQTKHLRNCHTVERVRMEKP